MQDENPSRNSNENGGGDGILHHFDLGHKKCKKEHFNETIKSAK